MGSCEIVYRLQDSSSFMGMASLRVFVDGTATWQRALYSSPRCASGYGSSQGWRQDPRRLNGTRLGRDPSSVLKHVPVRRTSDIARQLPRTIPRRSRQHPKFLHAVHQLLHVTYDKFSYILERSSSLSLSALIAMHRGQ